MTDLRWQSKTVLVATLPISAVALLLESSWWIAQRPSVALWGLSLSALLGLAAWRSRSATPAAALTGALFAACFYFATATWPYQPWHTALTPLVALILITSLATRFGRRRKQALGTAEPRSGRRPVQVAANLGAATVLLTDLLPALAGHGGLLARIPTGTSLYFAIGLAALAEAAADTISSELGQLFSATPRLITTLRRVAPGTDGAISLAGSFAGILAAVLIAAISMWAVGGGPRLFGLVTSGALIGLFVDSLLGATLERRGLLNNDAVNFLSTLAAALTAFLLLLL